MILCPTYGLVQVRQLTLNIRFSAWDVKCPISNWEPYMIESALILVSSSSSTLLVIENPPSSGNCNKIWFSYPSIPVIFQCDQSFTVVLVLTKSIFIDNSTVTSLVKNGRCNPRLRNTFLVSNSLAGKRKEIWSPRGQANLPDSLHESSGLRKETKVRK